MMTSSYGVHSLRQMSVAGEGAARTAAVASFPPVSVTEVRVEGGLGHGFNSMTCH